MFWRKRNDWLITYINWLVTKMANRKPSATIKLLVRDILRFKLNTIQLAIAKKLSNNNNKQHPFDGAECSNCSRLDKAPPSTLCVFGTRYHTIKIPLFKLVSILMLLVLSSPAKAAWWTYLSQSSIFYAHVKTDDWQEAEEEQSQCQIDAHIDSELSAEIHNDLIFIDCNLNRNRNSNSRWSRNWSRRIILARPQYASERRTLIERPIYYRAIMVRTTWRYVYVIRRRCCCHLFQLGDKIMCCIQPHEIR